MKTKETKKLVKEITKERSQEWEEFRETFPAFKKLTVEQRRYIKAYYVENQSRGNAAIIADPEAAGLSTPSQVATRIEGSPVVQEAVQELYEKAGLTDELLYNKLREGLEATTVVKFEGDAYDSQLPDHQARLAYLKLAFERKHGKKSVKEIPEGGEGGSKTVNFNFNIKGGKTNEDKIAGALMNMFKMKKESDIIEGEESK